MKVHVIERFIGIIMSIIQVLYHLRKLLMVFFSQHGLSIVNLRGQRYDRASNIQGEFHGLKALILKENECDFYIHCFAHQLQLALINSAKNHGKSVGLFFIATNVVKVMRESGWDSLFERVSF
ncbi:hypothetical protein IC575_027839 [Cucumis melo]